MSASSKALEYPVRFGTSGHRGILSLSFTTLHVEAIARAIAQYLSEQSTNPQIVVGYDPRTGNSPTLSPGTYTQVVTDALINEGITVKFLDDYAPTPLVSWVVDFQGIEGGLVLSASHNPPNYNGIKFNGAEGAPAPTRITETIEQVANQFLANPKPYKKKPGKLQYVNFSKHFCSFTVQQIFETCQLKPVTLSQIPIVVDAKHGTVAKIWQLFFDQLGLKSFNILHPEPISDFAGLDPNPTHPTSIATLRAAQKDLKGSIACANDPDGDRHIILDEKGNLLRPEEISIIILDFLNKRNCPLLGIASTVASSSIVQQAAERLDIEYLETPVGFKYFTSFLKQAKNLNQHALAVESSGGFSGSFHTLEKCGFLPILLILLIMHNEEKSLHDLHQSCLNTYGKRFFYENSFKVISSKKNAMIQKIHEMTIQDFNKIFDQPIKNISRKDGSKILFENGDWVLIRISGTEPLARIYCESQIEKSLNNLINLTPKLIDGF